MADLPDCKKLKGNKKKACKKFNTAARIEERNRKATEKSIARQQEGRKNRKDKSKPKKVAKKKKKKGKRLQLKF